jgi:uncharacterized membrane protein YesL
MFSYDGRLYRILTWVSNICLLSLLYLATCILVVTIPPATAALFGVVRKWVLKEDPPMFSTFFSLFRENAGQSYIASLIFLLVGVFFAIDFYSVYKMKYSVRWIFFDTLCGLALLYVVTLMYVFPLMVHTYSSTRQLITNGLKIAMFRPHLTLFNLFALFALSYICSRIPMLLLLLYPTAAAYVTFWCANQKFKKIFEARAHSQIAEAGNVDCK